MTNDLAIPDSELDLANEVKLKKILELLLVGDEERKKYSVRTACEKVGLSKSTYYRLREQGMLESAKQKIAPQVSTVVQEQLLPIQQDRWKLIARVAMGLPARPGSAEPTIGEMLKANQMIDKVLPVHPIDRDGATVESPLEHLKSYQPKTINLNFFGDQGPDWLYNGGGVPQFGHLDGEVVDSGEVDDL